MKKASFARVDERLIHGQVMTAWVKKYWIKKIILVDDEIVQDSFMQEVLSMSAPRASRWRCGARRTRLRSSVRIPQKITSCCYLRN